ncbi:MAG: 3-hydroxyacyl-CoA dehydrogenase NAD-binding domain-containing protein [Proteobacteria bacterium]|nr:3-hydroxyacyl-CoA dehydrogenase NAD-binding domain-containing protein [Pseudomonadota bacterium]
MKDAAIIERIAVVGAGVIGASWATLFLAAGLEVDIFDPADDAEASVRDYIATAWPVVKRLTPHTGGNPDAIRFFSDAGDAVANAQFVQENVPERLPVKLATYAEIEPRLVPGAIVATSTSGLMLSELQAGWTDPSRLLLAHPFNPPHLIPLVELFANEHTAPGILETAEAFYASLGKETIRLQREVPGHVANRLQAALWREAIHLVTTGVASVGDVDKAIWAGPGIRWAAMGPHTLFSLATGAGGMRAFCERFADSFHRWWPDLGTPQITEDVVQKLADGIADEWQGQGLGDIGEKRDALILDILEAVAKHRSPHN